MVRSFGWLMDIGRWAFPRPSANGSRGHLANSRVRQSISSAALGQTGDKQRAYTRIWRVSTRRASPPLGAPSEPEPRRGRREGQSQGRHAHAGTQAQVGVVPIDGPECRFCIFSAPYPTTCAFAYMPSTCIYDCLHMDMYSIPNHAHQHMRCIHKSGCPSGTLQRSVRKYIWGRPTPTNIA